MEVADAAWVAGIFEGLSIHRTKEGSPRLIVHNRRFELVEKLQYVTGVGTISGHYVWQVNNRAQVERVLEELLPYLTHEKASYIVSVLDANYPALGVTAMVEPI